MVKIDLFSDFNKFRQSSCGVQFLCSEYYFYIQQFRYLLFSASSVPQGHLVKAVHGFIEELVVNDDPEYQWIDKIRSMRASNEARQVQFSKLSGTTPVTTTQFCHCVFLQVNCNERLV